MEQAHTLREALRFCPRSVKFSVTQINADKLRGDRDSLNHWAKRSFQPRKQSRNRSIPTSECSPLYSRYLQRYSIIQFHAFCTEGERDEGRPSPPLSVLRAVKHWKATFCSFIQSVSLLSEHGLPLRVESGFRTKRSGRRPVALRLDLD